MFFTTNLIEILFFIVFIKWVFIKREQNHRAPDTYINNDNTNVINEFKPQNRQKIQKAQKDEKQVFQKYRRYKM